MLQPAISIPALCGSVVSFHCMLLSNTAPLFVPFNSGLVPELPSSPQEAREPQPHVQHAHDLTAARPPVAAHPDPRGAAVHGLRRPRRLNALRTALLHRQ